MVKNRKEKRKKNLYIYILPLDVLGYLLLSSYLIFIHFHVCFPLYRFNRFTNNKHIIRQLRLTILHNVGSCCCDYNCFLIATFMSPLYIFICKLCDVSLSVFRIAVTNYMYCTFLRQSQIKRSCVIWIKCCLYVVGLTNKLYGWMTLSICC